MSLISGYYSCQNLVSILLSYSKLIYHVLHPLRSPPLAANDLELDMTTDVEASIEAETLLGTTRESEIMTG